MVKFKKTEYKDGDTITCPNCDQDKLTYDKKKDKWLCTERNCGYSEQR